MGAAIHLPRKQTCPTFIYQLDKHGMWVRARRHSAVQSSHLDRQQGKACGNGITGWFLLDIFILLKCGHCKVLVVTLDEDLTLDADQAEVPPNNLFLNYLSRIHREEDFQFMLSGITRLLMNPLVQTYLPGSQKRVWIERKIKN